MTDKNQDFSAGEVLPEEPGVPAPDQAPQPGVPGPGKEVPITSGCESQQDFLVAETEAAGVPSVPLKGPGLDSLTHAEPQL